MATNNYLKIMGGDLKPHRVVFFFDDRNESSINEAWGRARALADSLHAIGNRTARVVLYNTSVSPILRGVQGVSDAFSIRDSLV